MPFNFTEEKYHLSLILLQSSFRVLECKWTSKGVPTKQYNSDQSITNLELCRGAQVVVSGRPSRIVGQIAGVYTVLTCDAGWLRDTEKVINLDAEIVIGKLDPNI